MPDISKITVKASDSDQGTVYNITDLAAAPQSTTYTKNEVDTALNNKVDKVSGKGLSTNDFTDTDKINLATALTTANAAAPQSTTYTKDEVDTALAAKLNTVDVDASLSSTSTNPVQNKVVQAPVARLVDAGKKNLLKNNATSQSTVVVNPDGTMTINGTNSAAVNLEMSVSTVLPPGDYVLSSDDIVSNVYLTARIATGGAQYTCTGQTKSISFHLNEETQIERIYLFINTGTEISNLTIKPMLCTAEDYTVSPEFVPYAPSNRELYKQNVEQDVYFQGNVTNFDTAIKISLGSTKYGDDVHGRYKVGLMVTNPNGTTANLYYIAISTNNSVTIDKMFGASTITFTGSYDGSKLTLTPSTKMWGGVRIIWLD